MGKQGWLIADRPVEVTGEVRHRCLQIATGLKTAHTALIHPGAATLFRTSVEVEVELPAQGVVFVGNREQAHIFVPGISIFDFGNSQAIEFLYHRK